MNIEYTNSLTIDEFNFLRTAVGWQAIENELAANGIKNSAFLVCARDGEKAIGMARVITDYGYVVFVHDVIVLPEYQGNGTGAELMRRVMNYIDENISQGQRKIIHLMSKTGKEEFYEKFGFFKRPKDDYGYGMTLLLDKS